MDITANDVENVTFATAKKGYDADQVDRFLDNVAATLRALEEQIRNARAHAVDLEGQAKEQQETEEMMRRTLLVAQRASDEAVAEAQAQARDLVTSAEAQARDLEATARSRADELEGRMQRQRQAFDADIESLRRFHNDFRQSLQQMITEHADLLHKTGRLAEALPEMPSEAAQPPSPRPAGEAPQPPRPAQSGEPRHAASEQRQPPQPPPPVPAPPQPPRAPAPPPAPEPGVETGAPPPPQVAQPAAPGQGAPPAARPATAPEVPEARRGDAPAE